MRWNGMVYSGDKAEEKRQGTKRAVQHSNPVSLLMSMAQERKKTNH